MRRAGSTLTPEVEPFHLIVLHDQGYSVLTETQIASNSTIRIEPWTAENGSFRAERKRFAGSQ